MTEPDGPLSDRLRASAGGFEPSPPRPDEIRRRGLRRRWGRRAGVGVGTVVIVVGILAPLIALSRLHDDPALYTPGGPQGSRLVFGSLIDDRYVLSTANGDGSDIRQLPIPITEAIDPSWSPDGSQIVFSGGERGNTEPTDLYVVNADGSGLRRLTDDPDIVDWDPAWSPDGTTVAFTRAVEPTTSTYGEHRIATLDIATGDIEMLPFDGRQANDPAWSSDGGRIAFVGNVDGMGSIFVMNADGTGVQRLTEGHDRWSDLAPAWSPDGGSIAFDRQDETSNVREGGIDRDIYVMGSDGSDLTQLTSSSAFEAAPEWSPDGSRIGFIGLIDTQWIDPRKSELYTMRPDGTDIARLTTGAATGYSPNGFAAPSWTEGSIGLTAPREDDPVGEPRYYVDGARPSERPDGAAQCVPWSPENESLVCGDLPEGYDLGPPPGGIDRYPDVCTLALEMWDFDPDGTPVRADLEDAPTADETVLDFESCYVTPVGSYPGQNASAAEYMVSFALAQSTQNTHVPVDLDAEP